jgi:hypothetical protein
VSDNAILRSKGIKKEPSTVGKPQALNIVSTSKNETGYKANISYSLSIFLELKIFSNS